MLALQEFDRCVCYALHSPLASPTALHQLTLSNTKSHFFPLCAPIVVTLRFLSRGISQLEKVFLNGSDLPAENFERAYIAKNHKLLWRALRVQRRLGVKAAENIKMSCKSQNARDPYSPQWAIV